MVFDLELGDFEVSKNEKKRAESLMKGINQTKPAFVPSTVFIRLAINIVQLLIDIKAPAVWRRKRGNSERFPQGREVLFT